MSQRPVTASLEFLDFNVEAKPAIGTGMINGLTNFPSTFTNPPIKIDDLTNLNDQLPGAIVKAATGDKTSIAALINLEKRWNESFKSTAKYVGSVANGNAEIILEGGCKPTASENQPAQHPSASANVKATAEPGRNTATVSCDADGKVKAYLYAAVTSGMSITQDGEGLVIKAGNEVGYLHLDTHSKALLHNLTTGVPLTVYMLPINSAGSGPLSDGHNIIPQ